MKINRIRLGLLLLGVMAGGSNGVGARSLAAQVPTTPTELGMGGAFLGVARGHESIFLAPGNIALPNSPVWSVAFPQAAFGVGIGGFDLRDVEALADFDNLSAGQKDDLEARLTDNGVSGNYALRAPLVAISVGRLGLGVAYTSVGSHTISGDLAELMLEGYEDGRTTYDVGNTAGERASFWELAGTYGHNLGGLSVGATGRYIRGGTLVRTRMFQPRVDTVNKDVEVDYAGVLVRGGSGYALDLGAAVQASPTVTLSAAVSNALSNVSWSEDRRFRKLTLDRTMIDDAEPQVLINEYEASEVDFAAASSATQAAQTAEGLYDDANFPAVARFGVGWKPFSSTWIAADFHRKLTDGRFGDSWEQRLAVGAQQSLWILALRAGYAVGDDGGKLVAGGFSLGPLDLGVARYRHGEGNVNPSESFIATFGLAMDQPW